MSKFDHFNSVGITVFLLCIFGGITVEKLTNSTVAIVLGGLIGVYFLFAIKVVDQCGMNMLYEAIREKGAMVIVPSSAIETMGLGGRSLQLHCQTALDAGRPTHEEHDAVSCHSYCVICE